MCNLVVQWLHILLSAHHGEVRSYALFPISLPTPPLPPDGNHLFVPCLPIYSLSGEVSMPKRPPYPVTLVWDSVGHIYRCKKESLNLMNRWQSHGFGSKRHRDGIPLCLLGTGWPWAKSFGGGLFAHLSNGKEATGQQACGAISEIRPMGPRLVCSGLSTLSPSDGSRIGEAWSVYSLEVTLKKKGCKIQILSVSVNFYLEWAKNRRIFKNWQWPERELWTLVKIIHQHRFISCNNCTTLNADNQ